MIIFGWGHKKIKRFASGKEHCCSRCNNQVYLELVHVSIWFTLFFIPVIPYKNIYALTCPVCGMAIEIEKHEFDEFRGVTNKEFSPNYVNSDGTRKTETQLNYIKAMQEQANAPEPK